jgi:hypothetical protein
LRPTGYPACSFVWPKVKAVISLPFSTQRGIEKPKKSGKYEAKNILDSSSFPPGIFHLKDPGTAPSRLDRFSVPATLEGEKILLNRDLVAVRIA